MLRLKMEYGTVFLLSLMSYVILGCGHAQDPLSNDEFQMAPGKPDKSERIPALNLAVDPPKPVIVAKQAVDNSPVLEPADLVILFEEIDGVILVSWVDSLPYDVDTLLSVITSLGDDITIEVRQTDPFALIDVGGSISLETVVNALNEIDNGAIVGWFAGRAVGWGNAW